METLTTTVSVVWQKKSSYLMYKSLPGEICTGCMNRPQLGKRFCNLHEGDHQELDKHALQVNAEDASKEFGGVLGPLLRSKKSKEDGKHWAQVDRILESKSLRNKKFSKVNSNSLYLENIIIYYHSYYTNFGKEI